MNPFPVPNEGGRQVNILGIPMTIRIHGRDIGTSSCCSCNMNLSILPP